MRVLLLSTDLERGGYPLRLGRMAPLLATIGIEPVVGCLAAPGPVSEDLTRAGIETFACNARSAGDVGALTRLARHIARVDPDVIHAGLFHANVAARLVGRLDRSRPVITTTVTIEIERRWHNWLESLTARASDRHVVNAAPVKTHVCDWLGFDPGRVVVIPNAIDFAAVDATAPADRAEFRIPRSAPLVVWAGRLDPVKDFETMLDALVLIRRNCDARLLILGDGRYRRRIETLMDRSSLRQSVILAGWRHDVWAWLKAADVLLFTSRTEGSPNTVLEAIATGCPVVTSDIPACRDLIPDRSCGWLCPVGASAMFADAVLEVIHDRNGRIRRATAAHRRIRSRHCMSFVLQQWRWLYAQVEADARPVP